MIDTIVAISLCWLLPAVLYYYLVMVSRSPATTSSEFVADAAALEHNRASRALTKRDALALCSVKSDYDVCLRALIRNIFMGPFTTTSGVVIPYYLNCQTSLMDKDVATAFARVLLDVLHAKFLPHISTAGEPLLVVGVETWGGVMASQLSAIASLTHAHLLPSIEFVWMRKKRKPTGTKQQLEGPNHITTRSPSSAARGAVFLDDAISSGTSLYDVALEMKRDYNVDMEGAIVYVDRPGDRANRTDAPLSRPEVRGATIVAIYDVAMIDPHVDKGGEKGGGHKGGAAAPAAARSRRSPVRK